MEVSKKLHALIAIYVSHFIGMEDSIRFHIFVNADDARRSDGAPVYHFFGASLH